MNKSRWESLITSDLTHLSSESNYTYLHYKDGSKKLMSRTLKDWQERLPHFLRIGRRFLVAPDHITGWSNDFTTGYINHQPFKVSRRAAGVLRKEGPTSTLHRFDKQCL
ncbi:LytTr DNA-binding domain-containing protein [Larkinella arboricola]|uniref:LytTr DNA-binding domain-containing protein n=1 Tax=Larkinella arboricola TaxID=643671 RepID=A0A327X2E7_LARAB|nr:LytTR family DNA-binding domain-containing protein [Larkinella arboricola]RAK00300.1 LytTr DNA-binding domain-containing protein [Larkinella arboricola]